MTPRGAATLPAEAVYRALETRPEGLSTSEARARLARHGPNELPSPPRPSALRELLRQVGHFMALLLWAAGALAFLAGMPELGWAIFAVVLLNGAFGFWQERRAERAIAALERLVPARARAVRDGRVADVAARELVPGDVLVLEEGDRVPADARLVLSRGVKLDLSALTGESVPADRDDAPAAREGPVAERRCLAAAGATVVEGRGRAVVLATGPATELGRIARLATAVRRAPSTLERDVGRLVRLVAAFAVAAGISVLALVRALGAGRLESLLFALGVIVANVPEGLLPAITITLAANVQRMTRRRALVRRLSSVETLASVDVVCTDKTGTLTENRLAVRRLWLEGAEVDAAGQVPPAGRRLLAAAALCTDAPRARGVARGAPDATERALVEAAAAAGLDVDDLRARSPRLVEHPFDSRRRRMTVVLASLAPEAAGPPAEGGPVAIVKGALLEVLPRCRALRTPGGDRPLDGEARTRVLAAHDDLARRGHRILAVALRRGEGLDRLAGEAVERDLVLLGLLAMEDPPRPGVRQALATCRRAGIAVTLVTGDHGLTALALAGEVGLAGDGARLVEGPELEGMDDEALDRLLSAGPGLVFARVAPEQKLRLVRAYQRLGHVVAVTGDGVNDAPALRAAHVGIAMGRGGTDVAREAADIVLLDDDFATLVAAVEEGRATWSNVRKFLAYVFTSNVPELAPFVAMAALGVPPALTILQILAIDLGTDMLPALALGAEPPEPGAMARPPQARLRPLLDGPLLARAYGLLGPLEAALSLGAFFLVFALAGFSLEDLRAATPALLAHTAAPEAESVHRLASTAAFAAIVWCQVGNVLACRSERLPATAMGLPRTRMLHLGVAIELGLLLAIVYLPPLQPVFGTAPLPALAWPLLVACAPAMVLADAAAKAAVGWLRRPPPRRSACAPAGARLRLRG
jgi:Ca2+-transporting ATPase